MTTTDKLLDELNEKLGLASYLTVGHSYFADIWGDGRNVKLVWTVIDERGGVVPSNLNGATARERCDNIRCAIARAAV